LGIVFLGLGSNIEDREKNLKKALKALKKSPKLKIEKISSVYETEPWEMNSPNWFLNLVIKAECRLPPLQLLDFIEETEKKLGRKTKSDNTPRTVDIDILFYNDWIFHTPKLVVPHPLLEKRRFVLVPLAEIEPDWEHPLIQKDIKTILKDLNDKKEVKFFKKPEELV